MNIIEKRKTWFIISLLIIIAGLVAMPIFAAMGQGALNYDIEFRGGTALHVDMGKDFSNAEVRDIVVEQTGQASPQIQRVMGTNEVIIKVQSLNAEQRADLYEALKEAFQLADQEPLSVADVSPTISTEMQTTALFAIFVASIAMLIYITFRFHDYRAGVSAVVALIHDVLIVLAVYAILRVPVNNSFVAAMLTIVGYSINDTIVVFDRIRENRRSAKKGDLAGMVNRSITQTITRSINTSLTTLITIATLYILGVESIRQFAMPLLIGIMAGTYSSIFIASPVWYVLKAKEEAKYAKA